MKCDLKRYEMAKNFVKKIEKRQKKMWRVPRGVGNIAGICKRVLLRSVAESYNIARTRLARAPKVSQLMFFHFLRQRRFADLGNLNKKTVTSLITWEKVDRETLEFESSRKFL